MTDVKHIAFVGYACVCVCAFVRTVFEVCDTTFSQSLSHFPECVVIVCSIKNMVWGRNRRHFRSMFKWGRKRYPYIKCTMKMLSLGKYLKLIHIERELCLSFRWARHEPKIWNQTRRSFITEGKRNAQTIEREAKRREKKWKEINWENNT